MLTLGMELINIFGTKSVAPKASANFDDWHGHIAITRNGKDHKAYSIYRTQCAKQNNVIEGLDR